MLEVVPEPHRPEKTPANPIYSIATGWSDLRRSPERTDESKIERRAALSRSVGEIAIKCTLHVQYILTFDSVSLMALEHEFGKIHLNKTRCNFGELF